MAHGTRLTYSGKVYTLTSTHESKERAFAVARETERYRGDKTVVKYSPGGGVGGKYPYGVYTFQSRKVYLHPLKKNPRLPSKKDMTVETWFERDRAHVELKVGNVTILEFWDNDVTQLVEDGFLDPKDWKGSMIEYAQYLGVFKTLRKSRAKKNPPLMVIGNPPEIVTLKSGYEKTKKSPTSLTFRRFTMDDIKALGTTGQREFWFEDNQGFARRLRLASSLKTWKRDSTRYEATFKYGMYESERMTTQDMLDRILVLIEEKENPPSDNLMSDSVHEVRYTHRGDGEAYKHSFKKGVRMVAEEDGSISMYHPTKRIHEEFPD